MGWISKVPCVPGDHRCSLPRRQYEDFSEFNCGPGSIWECDICKLRHKIAAWKSERMGNALPIRIPVWEVYSDKIADELEKLNVG